MAGSRAGRKQASRYHSTVSGAGGRADWSTISLHDTPQVGSMPVEPELQFEPEAAAAYDLAAKVLNIIKQSGVTKFGFVGNEKYRVFGK